MCLYNWLNCLHMFLTISLLRKHILATLLQWNIYSVLGESSGSTVFGLKRYKSIRFRMSQIGSNPAVLVVFESMNTYTNKRYGKRLHLTFWTIQVITILQAYQDTTGALPEEYLLIQTLRVKFQANSFCALNTLLLQ